LIYLKREELVKKLKEAAKKMENDKNDYIVKEHLTTGRGEGNYRLEFHAKKKGGFGFGEIIKSAAKIAAGTALWGASGFRYRTAREADKYLRRYTLEPIEETVKGSEIASILYRWAETIPQGFIETIGSDLLLPEEDKYISATIKPGKEIKITIDFAKLKGEEKKLGEEAVIEEEYVPPSKPTTTISQIPEVVPVPVMPEAMKQYFLSQSASLYAEGTLKNTEKGFSLQLDNKFYDTGIVAPIKMTVDGVEIDSEKITISIGEKTIKNTDISLSTPLIFKKGQKATIEVEGVKLPTGPHRIDIETSIQGVGKINLTLMENI